MRRGVWQYKAWMAFTGPWRASDGFLGGADSRNGRILDGKLMEKLKLRWGQLDLARQMETFAFIKEYIDLIAQNGYNGLLLYLEDRIRTPSYPYAAQGEYYTLEDIRQIVKHATSRKIEIIPCVSLLGHAERFLSHPALADLAELRDGATGRFGNVAPKAFCAIRPEVRAFIRTYLADIIPLFPSRYFHAGLDEVWDIAMCPDCRKAAPHFAGEAKLFGDYVRFSHDLLKRRGKRMLMWSDMFEFYDDLPAALPRDIIMVDWRYGADVRGYSGHFRDLRRDDMLARWRGMGFDAMIGFSDFSLTNPRSFLEHAEDLGILGGLTTAWERTETYMDRALPIIAYAGRLMAGEPDAAAMEGMTKQLFQCNDPLFVGALRTAFSVAGRWRFNRDFILPSNGALVRNAQGLPYDAYEATELSAAILTSFRPRVAGPAARRVFDDLIFVLEARIESWRLEKLAHDIVDRGLSAERSKQLTGLRRRLKSLLKTAAAEWPKRRGLLSARPFTEHCESQARSIDLLAKTLKVGRYLKVRFCLVNQYGAERTTIELREKGVWQTAADGVFKSENTADAVYEWFFPIPPGAPDAIRFNCRGFGGQGIAYAEIIDRGRRLRPCAIIEKTGHVADESYILSNDARYAFFGNQSVIDAFTNREAASVRHSLTVLLSKSDD